MSIEDTFSYGVSRNLNVTTLELPYKGKRLSMVILLPDKANGVSALQKALTADHLKNFKKVFGMRWKTTQVYLPRFKLEDSFDLEDTLAGMGMKEAFDRVKADFSGMDGSKNLFISKVIHKSFLELNEEGSEAAAATEVEMDEEMGLAIFDSLRFKADHPFLFFIRENETGAILFLGKFSHPL